MALTVIPCGPSSRASARVSPTSAPLDVTYGASRSQPPNKVMLAMLTMRPYPATAGKFRQRPRAAGAGRRGGGPRAEPARSAGHKGDLAGDPAHLSPVHAYVVPPAAAVPPSARER